VVRAREACAQPKRARVHRVGVRVGARVGAECAACVCVGGRVMGERGAHSVRGVRGVRGVREVHGARRRTWRALVRVESVGVRGYARGA
jgi:hypothetical protein